ncbi:hypothetical protein Sango_1900600 [Sesamum angolense]|uniref:Uncharacterized protein n=1 Tax=Sesamum angolense TaxID=2727404 RepID=A0AAE1WIV2_9LAMI|nr:hypothetical protein Sango_1900600 [Sesamum angolense]
MEDAQAAKKKNREEKKKETKEETSYKKPRTDFRDKKPPSIGSLNRCDSHHARKAHIREAHEITLKEVLDVEEMEYTPLIQFGQAERTGPKNLHNDALVITVLLANYEVKFPTAGGVGEIQGDTLQSRKCYVEAMHKRMEEAKGTKGSSHKVQPAEELLNVELVPRDLEKITKIDSQLENAIQEEIIECLCHNIDIFACTPQDLEGIDPNVITHHLNIDPSITSVKQMKRHFGSDKNKIIQAKVDKIMAAVHIEEI